MGYYNDPYGDIVEGCLTLIFAIIFKVAVLAGGVWVVVKVLQAMGVI